MKSLPDIEIKQFATRPGPERYLAFDELARASTGQPIELEPPREALDLECSRLHTRTQCQRNGVGVPEVVSAIERRAAT